MCVGDVQCPKGAMTEAQKGHEGEEYIGPMSFYVVSEIISSDLDESQESLLLVQKKRVSAIRQKIGIPV